MTPIDEAALKADPSDSEIMEIAGRWFHTGENQHRADGYYYRSLGTPTNVRGSDLIEFARALLNRSQSEAPGIARAQQVLREMHEVNKGQQVADPFLFAALALDTVVPAEQPQTAFCPACFAEVKLSEVDAVTKDAMRWRAWKAQPLWRLNKFGGKWRITTSDAVLTEWLETADAAIDAAISNREAGGS